jgi:4-hydroxythreonine-4-phosphate dehydrogenase
MGARWLILADDLTGAADCAIAFAKRGVDTVVSWGDRAGDAGAAVLSVDTDSRRAPAPIAAARQLAAQAAHWRPGMRLYKKIDSTLRGQPAAELAAQLAALTAESCNRPPLAVVAPAFPATGRVTLGGRVVVNEVPLEQTPLWAREHTYASADLRDVLGSADLSAEVIDLDTIRAGEDAVLARMRDAERRDVAAVVCDGIAMGDLAIVASASLRLGRGLWVGSAGLAAAIAALTRPAQLARAQLPARSGVVLIVVGSLAENARAQARALASSGDVTPVVVKPTTLLAGRPAPPWQAAVKSLSEALAGGRPVLLESDQTESLDPVRGAAIASGLADLVERVAPRIGALVVTGGETACAVLSRLGVSGIRLIDEVEPGVPLGVTLGAHPFPVVTKAGAFGDARTLERCVERLVRSTLVRA